MTFRTTIVLLLSLLTGVAARGEPLMGPQVPVALAWDSNELLRVALRDARQIVAVDLARSSIVSRIDLPFQPASLMASDDRATLYVGGNNGEVLAIGPADACRTLRSSTGRGPTRVLPLGDSQLAVASLWDSSIRVISERDGTIESSGPVPFPVGAMIRKPDGRIIIADGFGRGLADYDPRSGRLRTRVLDGVNLHALALSGDGKELLIGHMFQQDSVPITASNIDSGLVLSSRLSAVPLTEFDDGEGREGSVVARRRVTLDGPRHGAADPSALAVSPDGSVVLIALSGAHQILKNNRLAGSPVVDRSGLLPIGHNLRLETLEVGRSPVDLAFDPSGTLAVTCDSMSDSLTVVRVDDLAIVTTIPLGTAGNLRRSAAQRGEAAFLDGRHGMDRWISCASCHARGHTNGLNFDTLGDGGYGASKNAPSLLGVGPTAPFAWTGQFVSLSDQIHQSLESSLRGPSSDETTTVADLSAYLESLTPPPPRCPPDDPAARRGEQVFQTRGCQACHKAPTYTSSGTKGVGLDDGPGGHRAFNPPSLRGVGWTAPYFHDGRAATLEQVLDVHPSSQTSPLSPLQRADLKAFLESL